MRKIDEIIIHCSATPEGRDFTITDIRRWHKARGWKDVGYHFVIHLDGQVFLGRSLSEIGAHCAGHNQHSIGICYIGGLAADGRTPKDTRTEAQKSALSSLIRKLLTQFPTAEVYGHRDFAQKACPSFDARSEYNPRPPHSPSVRRSSTR